MALIGEIRKNFWLVLIVLGLALAAFVIMDMTSSAQRGNTFNPSLGTVNGEKIDAREFSFTENILSQNSNIQDANERRENLWGYYVDKAIVNEEAQALGLNVSTPELNELQFGQNLSPIIQQSFFDPNLGTVNRQQLAQIQSAIVNNQGLTPDFRAFWSVQEEQIITGQLQNKITNLVTKSIYTPAWMAEEQYKQNNTRAQVEYIKIPFDVIEDDAVELTDADISKYIKENAYKYTNEEETRKVDYISFPVYPTSADSSKIMLDMSARTDELISSENDSVYAVNNGGSKPTLYFTYDQLPEALQGSIADLEVNEGFGPYLDNGIYSSVKLIDKKVIPDSVEARIIFRQAPKTNTVLVNQAKELLDSLKNLITSGAEDFDSLAIANSQDGSSAQGGDLGYLTQGMLQPELDRILFLDGNRSGQIFEVQTQSGLFLVEITDVIQNNYEPKYRLAYINSSIIPSQETQDSVLDIVNDFLNDYRSLEEMQIAAREQNLDLRSSGSLDKNDFVVGNLGSDQNSRNIVRWAFDPSNEPGDVSPDLFSFQDPIDYYTNKYVVVGLSEIVPKGLGSLASLKDEVSPIVRNQKKAESIKGSISSSDLNAIAAQYELSVDTLDAVSITSSFIPGLGNEPKVLAAIFNSTENQVSEPIIGNSGVYLVKPLEIVQANEAANIPSLRNSANTASRSQISFNLLEGLREKAKIKDERFEYGY